MDKLKVFTAFSGYDSQCLALNRLGIDYELVGWSEIDKYAIQAHNALFPQWADRNYGDISRIDWNEVPDFDLFTYSSPCQDFSSAGLQRGGEEGSGTRSSLLWECRRVIVAKRPKYLLLENVKALVSKKFKPLFNKWCDELAGYGYSNFAQVLNAKDYGIPQNRERIFLVSILGEAMYEFPGPFTLDKRLKDVLEENVDEKYYLSEKMMEYFEKHGRVNSSQDGVVCDSMGIAPTHTAGHGNCPKVIEMNAKAVSYTRDRKGKIVNKHLKEIFNTIHTSTGGGGNTDCFVAEPIIVAMRGRNPDNPSERGKSNGNYKQRIEPNMKGTSNTLTGVQKDNMVLEPCYRIRKLTPRECFRLMGVDDADIDKIQTSGISNNQQYKMAGNSIVVDVLYHIFRKMFVETEIKTGQMILL